MSRRLAGEIALDERRVGERIDAETEAVAVQAHATDHFLIRTQVGVLVVLDPHALQVAIAMQRAAPPAAA